MHPGGRGHRPLALLAYLLISGKPQSRQHLTTILFELAEASAGDSLLLSELSCLERSMLEYMEILSLAMQRGIHVYGVPLASFFIGLSTEDRLFGTNCPYLIGTAVS